MLKLPRPGFLAVTVAASPEQVWDLLADVTRTGEWSHETRGAEWLDGATDAATGVRFRGRNGKGRTRWSRCCEILTAERPHEISWRTVPTRLYPDSTIWRYDIAAAEGGGATVTQSFEVVKLSALFDRLFAIMIPAHRDRSAALTDDLHALGRVAAQDDLVDRAG